MLNELLPSPTTPGTLRPADRSAAETGGDPHGEVTIEILFDPPGHVRLPITDDEIIDRAQSIMAFGRAVSLITYDTGQSMRARAAGLRVFKMAMPDLP